MTSMTERGVNWPPTTSLQESLALLRVAAERPDVLDLRDSIAAVAWPDEFGVYMLGLALAYLADSDLCAVLERLRDGVEAEERVFRTRRVLDERGALQVARELLAG